MSIEALDAAYPDALQVEETGSHIITQIEGREFSIAKDGLPPEVLEIKNGRFVYTMKCDHIRERMARFQ